MTAADKVSAVTGDVLVVDDTVANLKLLADILGRAGHRVRLAGDGELALRSVQAKRPDLVLLDIRMPGMDGFEVCRRLKADAATRDIPVMFLSSLTETTEKTKAFALGAVDYLPKPVAAEEVLARVGNHLALSAVREHLEEMVAERTATLTAEITERKRAAEALRESRARLDAALGSMTDAVFISDASGQFIEFNEAFAVFHRFSNKAVCAKKLSEYPDIIDVFMANGELAPLDMWAVPRALRGETATNVEYGLRRKDTGESWVGSYSFSPIRDEAGVIVGSVIVGRDITEAKRIQSALHRSETRYRALFEMSRDALMIVEPPSWRFTAANPATIAMFGARGEEDFMSRAPWELSPERQPDNRASPDKAAEMMETAMRTGSHYFEWTHQRLSGEPFPASVLLARIEVEGQTMLQATVRDETERKRAEAEHERLTTAIEQAAETIFVTDAQGTIVYVNPAFEAVSGYTRAELVGRNPRLLKSGVQDEAFYRAFWETISDGKIWHGRLVNKKKDGTHYTEDATVSPVRDASGNIASYVAVKRDITRDLNLEAQLLQSQKMEGIGRLAGGVAHDFNNLLSVILSYTGFAFDSVPEGDRLREDLLEVRKAGERAASLTRQLLAFSRKQVLQPESLDLNRVLGNMEKMLRRIIGEDVDFIQGLAPELGMVRADPGQIEQVLMNLVVNARDAMPEGGKLTIETANVDLDAEYAAQHQGVVPGPYVMVAVTDSGIGMDEQTMAKIFEPFFTTKGLGKGTGLGLSTVFGIVKQSGGSIYVYSELGRGTTFKVFLPRELSTATATATSPAMVARRVTGTETILVVEDEEALRKVARRTLEAAGYTVLVAANGEDALLTSAQHEGDIHLLLTDVVMPQMGGRVLAEKLVKSRPALKVLYMSGYTDNAIVHHGVLDAGTQFLAKPFTAGSLAQKVQEVLAGGITSIAHEHAQTVKPEAETEGQVVGEDAIRALPRDLLDKLRKAVIGARYDEIVALVETIRTTQPELAAGIRRMVDLFDYVGLRNILREEKGTQRGG